jgi:hypothetical protein
MQDRGVIRNRQFATQVRDFSGLRYGTITPTDIDGLLDFGNHVFVLIETKYGDNAMPIGQRLAIERVVDAIGNNGKKAMGVLAQHNFKGDIDVANCIVTELRFNGKWLSTNEHPTVREIVDRFLKRYAPKYLTQRNNNAPMEKTTHESS